MMSPDEVGNDVTHGGNQRVALFRACAYATAEEILLAIEAVGMPDDVQDIRPAEDGLVMVRGRVGGEGDSFNAGEVTVTRAVVKLGDGRIGFSYLLGRSRKKARLAAIVDALGHDRQVRDTLQTALVDKIEARRSAMRRRKDEEAAATRVDFFTLVRGED